MSNTPRIERPKRYTINAWVDSDDMASWEAEETELDPSLPGIVFYDAYEAKPHIDQQARDIAELVVALKSVVQNFDRLLAGWPVLDAVECADHAHDLIAKHRKEVSDGTDSPSHT